MFAAQSSLSLWSHWNPQWNEQIKTETITSASGSKKWSESAFQTWKESNCQHVIRPTCTATTREVTFLTVPGVTVLAHEFPIEKKKKKCLPYNAMVLFISTQHVDWSLHCTALRQLHRMRRRQRVCLSLSNHPIQHPSMTAEEVGTKGGLLLSENIYPVLCW